MLSTSGNTIVADNSVTVSNEIQDDSISFEYRAKSTAIVNDRTKIKTVYKFDANGRELSSYQDTAPCDCLYSNAAGYPAQFLQLAIKH